MKNLMTAKWTCGSGDNTIDGHTYYAYRKEAALDAIKKIKVSWCSFMHKTSILSLLLLEVNEEIPKLTADLWCQLIALHNDLM